MGAAFIVTLREGLEAALIVSIILAYLRQLGRTDRNALVWLGTLGAVTVSAAVGAVIFAVAGEFEGRAEEIFEGLISLLAVGVLTWMVFWMRRQAARIRSEIQEKVDSALTGGGLALAGLAFVMVLREGIETALFLFGAEKATGETLLFFLGAALGLAVAAAIGFVLYRGSVRLNLRTFFRVTGALILVVAAGLLAFGIHELQEAGYLQFLTQHAFDLEATLNDDRGVGALLKAVLGYHHEMSVLEVAAWAAYLLIVGVLYFRPTRLATSVSKPAAQSTAS
ncbi:MAG: iron uptake transporter permease EfeU [Actinomycetota bacterium]